ncbi:MAG TPA: alanine--tRNA ligase [Verrucomicrobiaceae bacterium]
MTSAQIRSAFLDFFKSKQHAIVPSSSLMPDSPNLLFTNAGMNQFVPIFLGQIECPYKPGRAADTQKCIRAGGKHNDLDDVGLDTYHHTFFEMLGNWSFGDYFKKEAIAWSWELIVDVFKFPPGRVYATIYQPDQSKGDPSERDQEAWDLWAEKFRGAGVDPNIHIVNGNKKDNFWMMGETGPCGPCSEIHIDLTPAGDTKGRLVNAGSADCIEIWNNVVIQFNANPDGTFTPLPAQHVDTGMGFERLCSIIQCTGNFNDFANAKISNYETDVFRPIFDEIEKLSGKKYASTLPQANAQGQVIPTTEQEKIDVAFRVIADHIRTLGFSIADGIQPGNTDRNYVLRRILRRAVRYGRSLGFREPFFYKLVDVLAAHMGGIFPEIRTRHQIIKDVLKREEEAFNRTLDKGIGLFNDVVDAQLRWVEKTEKLVETFADAQWAAALITETQEGPAKDFAADKNSALFPRQFSVAILKISQSTNQQAIEAAGSDVKKFGRVVSDTFAFRLYDEQGFPLDLTELMARERGLTVDVAGFNKLMEEQRSRARAAQKKQVIALSEIETKEPTVFVGYDALVTEARVLEVVALKEQTAVVLDTSTAYAEMGGQVGDSGLITHGADTWPVVNTQKSGNTWLHFIGGDDTPDLGAVVELSVDSGRRRAIERHHTVTHLLHWALHEVVSREATQKGSAVAPDKLTFDFNSAALTPQQVRDIEMLVNERIVENGGVSWIEVPYADIKTRPDIMQFFGDKYGDVVRVVQIGGHAHSFDGYSMELCGGTHTRGTGEIGLFRIVSEGAVAAGVRRIEAIAGLEAFDAARRDSELLKTLAGKVMAQGSTDLEKKLDALLAHQKELEKSLKAAQQREAGGRAKELLAGAGNHTIIANLGAVDGDYVMAVNDALKGQFNGIIVLGSAANGSVVLTANVSKDFQDKAQAGKIIQAIAPIVGGKGGGKPDFARGGGKEVNKLEEALAHAREIVIDLSRSGTFRP